MISYKVFFFQLCRRAGGGGGTVGTGGGGGGGGSSSVPGLGNIPSMGVGVPGVTGAGSPGSSGFTFTQDQHMRIILGTRSPEPRPRRNGIVTNPSLKAAHAKAAHLLRNGLSGRPRPPPARPNGLPLKKETPL